MCKLHIYYTCNKQIIIIIYMVESQPISRISFKFFVKFIFVYMREGPSIFGEMSLLTTRDLA